MKKHILVAYICVQVNGTVQIQTSEAGKNETEFKSTRPQCMCYVIMYGSDLPIQVM